MNKENTVNEKEAVDAIYKHLNSKGKKITKSDIDTVLDASHDLAIDAFVKGKGIKVENVGTLHIVQMKERSYKVPDGKGGWIEGTAPAHKTVHFKPSEKLLEAMNNLLS